MFNILNYLVVLERKAEYDESFLFKQIYDTFGFEEFLHRISR
jgi:hypothetical protein